MNTYKSIVLIALFAGCAVAANQPIKNRLAQINSKSLAQVGEKHNETDDCDFEKEYKEYEC